LREALAATTDLTAIRQIADQAKVVREAARKAGWGLDLCNQAEEVKLRAERKGGQLLADRHLRGGDHVSGHGAKRPVLRDLGFSHSQSTRWQSEASLPEAEFAAYIRQVAGAGKKLTAQGVKRLAESRNRRRETTGDSRSSFRRLTSALHDLAAQRKRFACIYADPPWLSAGTGPDRAGSIARALADVPVTAVASRQAHLHLWVTPELLDHGIQLLKDWGFAFKTSLGRTKALAAYSPYWQHAHDVLLTGVRGSLAFRDLGNPSWIEGQDVAANRDCAEIRKLLEKVSPPHYLDLFGCARSPGWTMLGFSGMEGRTPTSLPGR
jgi:N6-adenosine-specific RNA methylase IME4